ncbi:MAG: hypothetical protein WCG27_12790, partial [Pseudomonadota bacterium]
MIMTYLGKLIADGLEGNRLCFKILNDFFLLLFRSAELIKNIDEIQYKKLITSDELSRIELRLLEIQKDQDGNR